MEQSSEADPRPSRNHNLEDLDAFSRSPGPLRSTGESLVIPQYLVGRGVGHTVEEDIDGVSKQRLAGIGPHEERHRRAKLHVVPAQNLGDDHFVMAVDGRRGLSKAWTENRVEEVRPGLVNR